MNNWNRICFHPTDILLPKEAEMEKWSVVACDQYTSQPEYWEEVRCFVGSAPSTLNLMLPEAELEQANPIVVRETMDKYLENGTFKTLPNSFVYLERTQSDGKIRQGLLGALDLECYNYHKGSVSLCRATEGTVEERLPPRIRVRQGAALEMPHIMVLIDDPLKTVVEPLKEKELDKIYDFTLMQGGGHLIGYALPENKANSVYTALHALMGETPTPLLYAVGDGNHSLATAKACFEQLKAELGEAAMDHPARYCLVELVNIHSPALEFEPIHRVVFDTDIKDLMAYLTASGMTCGETEKQKIQVVQNGIYSTYSFKKKTASLAVGTLQNTLDSYLEDHAGRVDYIHGAEVVEKLTMQENSIGFILSGMEKSELFPTVVADGALPRKTFSMGHAQDKRFYLECRKIK